MGALPFNVMAGIVGPFGGYDCAETHVAATAPSKKRKNKGNAHK